MFLGYQKGARWIHPSAAGKGEGRTSLRLTARGTGLLICCLRRSHISGCVVYTKFWTVENCQPPSKSSEGQVGAPFPPAAWARSRWPREPGVRRGVEGGHRLPPDPVGSARTLPPGDSVASGKLPDLLGTLFLRCKLGGYEGNTLSFRGGLRGSRVRSREAVGARAHRSCPQS